MRRRVFGAEAALRMRGTLLCEREGMRPSEGKQFRQRSLRLRQIKCDF